MREPARDQRQLQDEVDNWNRQHAIGTAVRVVKDFGGAVDTVTLSKAYPLGGHTPVVFVKGISGCYVLSRCKPISQTGAGVQALDKQADPTT